MLQRLNNKTVRGPGFVVSVPDIHQVRYTEREKLACVEIEGRAGLGEINWDIYSETLRGWEQPHEYDEMPRSKREEILTNISKSLELLEMPHRVV